MPHQCLKCGQVFEEGSSELLRDCPDCGGNRFFFTKEPLNEEERNSIIREVGKDINSVSIDLIGGDGDIVDKSGSRVTIKPKEIRKVVEQHLLEKKRTESEKKEKRVIREIDRFIKQRERPDAQRKKIEKRKEDREKKKMRRLELKKAKQDGVEEKRELRVKARMDAKKKRVKAKKTLKAREQLEEKALEKEKKPALKHSKKQIIEKKTGKLSLFGRIKIGKAPAKPEKIKHRLLSRKEKPGFPVFLRFDGTLEPNAANRISRMHRNRFASFLKYYKITEKIEDYNIVERMNEWEGKEVKMISHKGRNQIFTPYHWVGDKHRDK